MIAKRDELAAEDRWNVEALYKDSADWEKAFEAIAGEGKPRWPQLAQYKGRLGEGASTVKEAFETALQLQEKIERLYTYAHLRNDEDLTNDLHKGMYQRATMLYHEFGEEGAWLEPELLALPQEKLDQILQDPSLADYKFMLEKIVRMKAYTLTPKEEELVAMAGKALDAPSSAFSVLTNADFSFGTVEDGEGKEQELTNGSYMLFQRSDDRVLRKNSFEKLHSHYKGFENTCCELLSGQVQGHLFGSRSHNFDSCLHAALYPKAIDLSVYHSLIEAVRSELPAIHRYVDLRKEALGVDQIHLYDMYVPLSSEGVRTIGYEEAESLVIDSVAPLGSDYQKALEKGLLTDRWVDRYENENKRSGAYSSGCYGASPYILMNYKGLLNDTLTLAHEAGHSMHSLLSWKNQPYHYSHYSIFVAEVASTFNEELLFRKLLNAAQSDQERIFLINQKIDDIRATFFRQTMFAEFELWIHEMAEQQQPMTPQMFSEKYHALNVDYFGPNAHVDEGIAVEWARIPHFYYGYYVYQYATGVSAALSLAERVLGGGDAERDAYLGFLKGGGSEYPVELLKKAGVDLTTPRPVKDAIGTFRSLVDQLEGLMATA